MRRKLTAIVIAVFVFSLIAASAATLGGISNSAQLGAEATVVAGCDSDGITISYTTAYNTTTNAYDVTAVDIGDLDGCDTQAISVTLSDGTSVLGSDSGTVSGNANATFTASITAAAAAVTNVAVVVSG